MVDVAHHSHQYVVLQRQRVAIATFPWLEAVRRNTKVKNIEPLVDSHDKVFQSTLLHGIIEQREMFDSVSDTGRKELNGWLYTLKTGTL